MWERILQAMGETRGSGPFVSSRASARNCSLSWRSANLARYDPDVPRYKSDGIVSPSRAPVFSCAHYLQAPATQASSDEV